MVRAGYDAYNSGDVERALAMLHPEVEWWPAADEPIAGPYRGFEGYRRMFGEFRSVVPDIHVQIEELSVHGEHVITCLRYSGSGRDSGARVELRETHLARLEDGKIIEVREFREKAEALEALRGTA